jgi:hypothetical protein
MRSSSARRLLLCLLSAASLAAALSTNAVAASISSATLDPGGESFVVSGGVDTNWYDYSSGWSSESCIKNGTFGCLDYRQNQTEYFENPYIGGSFSVQSIFGGDPGYSFSTNWSGFGSSYAFKVPLPAGRWSVSTYQQCRYGQTYWYKGRSRTSSFGGTFSPYGPYASGGWTNYCDSSDHRAFDLAAAPSLVQVQTTDVGENAAIARASFKAHGFDTAWHVEWGTSTGYGQSTMPVVLTANGNTTTSSVPVALSDLRPGTTYHWRLVAQNAGGTLVTTDQQFTTGGNADATPPAVSLSGAAGPVATAQPEFSFSSDEPATFECRIDGGDWSDCGSSDGSELTYTATALGEGLHHFEVRATDGAGNTSEPSSSTVLVDTVAPTLNLPDHPTAEATAASGGTASFVVSGDDGINGEAPVVCDRGPDDTFPLGDTVVTCTAQDMAGHETTGTFTVSIVDTTGPALSVPTSPLVAEATGADGAKVDFDAKATDLVDGSRPVSCDPPSGSTFAPGETEVRCSSSDSAGNAGTTSFTVKVQDTTAPAVRVPDTTVEATGPDGAPVELQATADDLVDGDGLPVTCDPASGTTLPLGETSVSCQATDRAGNTGHGSGTVRVVDTTSPALHVPDDVTAEATGPDGAVARFETSASDLVSGDVPAGCSIQSGDRLALGDHTVECSASDQAGNEAKASFAIHVVDTTAPAITVPEGATAEASGPDGAEVSYDASATDLVDGGVDPSCAPASGSTFGVGDTKVTCSATDAHGNEAKESFTVTVTDTTAPAVNVRDVTAEATGPDGAKVELHASASDLVDAAVDAGCTPASGTTFPLGKTEVTCSATDAHGNTGSAKGTVTVVDTTAPSVSVPADMTVEATGPQGAVARYDASASDLVDGSVGAGCSPASGSTFAPGTTKVTCRSTDTAGNEGTGSFEVKVVDTTAPALKLPAGVDAVATGAQGAAVTFAVPASDLVDGAVEVSCSPASGSTFAPGTTTVACSATDRAGNTSTGSFPVRVTYAWSGFQDPIKAGALTGNVNRTVPLKFSLTGASAGISVAKATVLLGLKGAALSPVAVDSVSKGSFHYNLSTKGLAPGVYTVRVDLGDGVQRDATLTLS